MHWNLRRRALLSASAWLLLPLQAAGQDASPLCPLAAQLSPVRFEARCIEARWGILPMAESSDVVGTVSLLPVDALTTYRSGYPLDRANGLIWSGRGAAAGIAGGIVARFGRLTAAIAPEIVWAQNRDFRLPGSTPDGYSVFADPTAPPNRDVYLRPGSRARLDVGAGQSFVELALGAVTAGVSTERLWWGAGRRHGLLFSATAPGFPHAYLSAAEVALPGSGSASLEVLGGRLDESDWYDADARNDRRLLTATQAAWRLGFVPGLELAFSLVRHEPLPGGSLEAGQLVQMFTGDPSDEDADRRGSSMGSLSFRLALPESGIEVYGEMGRGDTFVDGEGLVSDTRHAQIKLMGFARTDTTSSGSPWRVWGELIVQALEDPQPTGVGSDLPEVRVTQGHTHEGQVLGDWIGPGSNAQILSFDWLGGPLPWRVFAERVRRNDDTYYRAYWDNYGFYGHDIEWTLGARVGRVWSASEGGQIRVQMESGLSRRRNRSFIGLDGLNWDMLREWNIWTDVGVRWVPGS